MSDRNRNRKRRLISGVGSLKKLTELGALTKTKEAWVASSAGLQGKVSVQGIAVHTFPSDFQGGVIKNLPANAGEVRDVGSIPGLGRSPGRGLGNPLQYSYLENPTEKPGRLQSIGSQRVGHDWSNLACTHTPFHQSLFTHPVIHSVIIYSSSIY